MSSSVKSKLRLVIDVLAELTSHLPLIHLTDESVIVISLYFNWFSPNL